VKRQRYQYKLKTEGKRSTLSDERIRLLNKIGFIYNSHDVVWEERLQELILFKQIHGHCIVPSNYQPNVQLAIWTKRQRRQYKKFQEGSSSSMTTERIAKLEAIGFVWDCRKIKKKDYQVKQQQQQKQQQDANSLLALSFSSHAIAATAAMNNVLQQQQQQHLQMLVQNQLLRNTKLAQDQEQNGGKEKDVAQGSQNNEVQDMLGQQQQELPPRIPKCEFFSFSRKFTPQSWGN
jgi:hypothetical protein